MAQAIDEAQSFTSSLPCPLRSPSMPAHDQTRLCSPMRAAGLFVCWVLAFVGSAGFAGAQTPKTKSAVASSLVLPTLASIEAADRSVDRTTIQIRRFRDGAGNVVSVRELLVVDAQAGQVSAHSLTFLGVEGQLPGSTLTQKWQQTYAQFSELYFEQSFRVRSLTKAQVNYTLHDIGPSLRAGRACRQTVVFPTQLDKSIWLLDIDAATGVVLFAVEFDIQLRVLSEVEVVNFVASAWLPPGQPGAPALSFAAAANQLGSPPGLLDPVVSAVAEYSVQRVEIKVDPWNGLQKLVLTYTDGIDRFFVTQKPGALDPFAGLPGAATSSSGSTIARYRDPAMTALVFWDDGVAFEVTGSGALQRLDDLAKRVYAQALSQ